MCSTLARLMSLPQLHPVQKSTDDPTGRFGAFQVAKVLFTLNVISPCVYIPLIFITLYGKNVCLDVFRPVPAKWDNFSHVNTPSLVKWSLVEIVPSGFKNCLYGRRDGIFAMMGRFSSQVYMRMFLTGSISKLGIISYTRHSGTECLYDKNCPVLRRSQLREPGRDEKRPGRNRSI